MKPFLEPQKEINDDAFAEQLIKLRNEDATGFVMVIMGEILRFLDTLGKVAMTIATYWVYLKMGDDSKETIKNVISNTNKVKELVDKNHYVSLSTMLLPCANGFKGNYPGYVLSLQKESEQVFKNASVLINDFQVLITEYLNNKSARQKVRTYTDLLKDAKKKRVQQDESFLEFFANGTNQRQRFDKMFELKQDIVPSVSNSVELYKYVLQHDPKVLNQQAQELSQRLQMVIDLQKNMSKEAMLESREAFVNLSEYALEVARQFEHMGKFMVRVEMAAVTGSNIYQKLLNQN